MRKIYKLNIHNKLINLDNTIHSILNYKLMGPASNLRLPKEKKEAKQQVQQKLSKKSVEANEKWTFLYILFNFQIIFNSDGILFNNLTPINQRTWTNTLKPRKFWEDP